MRHQDLSGKGARGGLTLAAMLLALSAAGLAGCGTTGGGFLGDPVGGSVGNRFAELFGASSQPAGTTPQEQRKASEPTCPGVDIRAGASTLAVGAPGKPASGLDLRYQGTITDTARECHAAGGTINAKVGVQGRVIVGPAGAPPSIVIPIRVAVVQEGPQPKTVFSKVYQTTVDMSAGQASVGYALVAEDVSYPTPTPEASENYIFYVGFDSQGLKPERTKPARSRKTRTPG